MERQPRDRAQKIVPTFDGGGDGGGLRRVLGLFDTTMIAMGCMIGAGIFRTPAHVAAGMQTANGILGLWALGGGIALCGALVFAELAGQLPHAGGQYVFLREAFGRFTAFLYGWLLIAAINSSAIAYIAVVFTDHLRAVVESLGLGVAFGPGLRRTCSIALIALLTVVNVRGIRLGAAVQSAAMLAKIAGILAVVAMGVWWVLQRSPGQVAAEKSAIDDAASWSWAGLGAAVLAVVFSYGGWQNVAAVASEIKNPQRTLPLGILLGTALVIALYLSVNWSMVSILGPAGLAGSETPAASAAGAVVRHGELLIGLLVMLSTFAIAQALLMVTPRIYFAMARDGVFFRSAGWIHPRYRTPAVAIAWQGAFAVLHLLVGQALDLLQVTVIADWMFFFLCGIALFVLRFRRPDAPRPYRAHGYPWLPALFVVFAASVVVSSLFHAERVAVVRAGGITAAGTALYFWWSRRQSVASSKPS